MAMRQPTHEVLFFICKLVFAALFAIQTSAANSLAHGDTKKMENANVYFEKPELLFKVDLQAAGLTYTPGDLDPQDAVWPSPAVVVPGFGVLMTDGGESMQSWRLVVFSETGALLWSVDLIKTLASSSPDQFIPEKIFVDNNHNVLLLASRSFDVENSRLDDFVLAVFGEDGKLNSTWDLSHLFYDGRVFVLDGKTIFNLERTKTGAQWYEYKGKDDKEKTVDTVFGNANAYVAGGIIDRPTQDKFQWLAQDQKPESLKLMGEPSSGENAVNGQGAFFGFIDQDAFESDDPEQDVFQQRRSMDFLYFDQKARSVINLGRVQIGSNWYAESDMEKILVYKDGQSVFDKDGNFYEIAWSPSSFYVYRYALNKEVVNRALNGFR
jgi:hypothetical protein